MSDSFHEVSFPVSLALGTTGGPERRTDIVSLSNGRESRNARWRDSRRRYDAGSGMKSADDLYALVAFFEARQGSLYGFRFKDPLDFSSADYNAATSATDQIIGTGDGSNRLFQLKKTYLDIGGQTERPIEKPVVDSVKIAIAGTEIFAPDFSIDHASGEIEFVTAPADGDPVSAGFEFDVPVRFDTPRLDINLSAFQAGHIPSVPLVEIKP